MTVEEIESMPAGREMDALIAERVMGWSPGDVSEYIDMPDENGDEMISPYTLPSVPHYSTSIEAAWEVADKIEAREFFIDRYEDGHWRVAFYLTSTPNHPEAVAVAETAPLAISRAALKAVMR